MPVLLKTSVVGEISATAALVATKESPQNTTASSAPSRGGMGGELIVAGVPRPAVDGEGGERGLRPPESGPSRRRDIFTLGRCAGVGGTFSPPLKGGGAILVL